ncbi:MAG: hypothetical protein QME66_08615 [Candidatus Eisenbacteria bacterium]|nr:hypothetical protein [Candidatus Eisenbacteria bacterium]
MKKRIWWHKASLGSVVLLSLASPSFSQTVDFWLRGTGLRAESFSSNVRQLGMAGLWVAVRDENNELNLYDFGKNTAWLPFDKESTYTDDDFTSSFRKGLRPGWDKDKLSLSRTRGVFYKVDYSAKSVGASLVVHRLGKEISLPDGTKSSFDIIAPTVEASLARALNPYVTVALKATVGREGEAKTSQEFYVVNQTSALYGGGGAVAVTGLGGVALGATLDFDRAKVISISKDNFHDDSYEYTAPSVTASMQGAVEAGETAQGAIELTYNSRTGDETGRINWSDGFPRNPLATNLSMKYDTYSDEYKSRELRTRWMVRVAPVSMNVGTFFNAYERKYWKTPESGWLGIVLDRDLTLGTIQNRHEAATGFSTGGGLVFEFPGRAGIIGGELEYSRADAETILTAGSWIVNQDDLALRFGLEVRVSNKLLLRGGVCREGFSPNRDVATYDLTVTELTAGAGVNPRGRDWSVDFAWGSKWWKGESLDLIGEVRKLSYYSLYCRFLF